MTELYRCSLSRLISLPKSCLVLLFLRDGRLKGPTFTVVKGWALLAVVFIGFTKRCMESYCTFLYTA